MSRVGVILYGPPGSGKDTVTSELAQLSDMYVPFRRLKAGPGRTAGYRVVDRATLDDLDARGDLLYRNARYGAEYAIDRDGPADAFADGRRPVLHLGQVVGVDAVTDFPAEWMTVLLWCSRDVTAARCTSRGDRDVAARLAVWDETEADLRQRHEFAWTLTLDTDTTSAADAAAAIDRAVSRVTSAAANTAGLVR